MRVHLTILTCVLLLAAAAARAEMIQNGMTLAGGAPVTASDETYGAASNVTDGDLANGSASEWLPNAASGWVTVDLGRVYRLTNVNLLNSQNFNDRWTDEFNVQVSLTGAFAGEEGTAASGNLQLKSLGWQDVPLPDFNDPANTAALCGRYLRFNALTQGAGTFGPGLCEITADGVPDRGVGDVAAVTGSPNTVGAKAYTATTALGEADPAGYTLRLLTISDPVSSVRSLGKPVTATLTGFGRDPAKVADGLNNPTGQEFLWSGGDVDLSMGTATIDLGEEILIDGFDLINTYNFNDRGTSEYIIRVSNDPSFPDGNGHNVLVSEFTSLDESQSHTLSEPVLGRYVRFIASDRIGYGPGLDELSVYGRTFTSQVIAAGSAMLGSSTTFEDLALSSPLPDVTNLLALEVTTADGWSSLTLHEVTVEETVIPEPATAVLLAAGLGVLSRRRRRA